MQPFSKTYPRSPPPPPPPPHKKKGTPKLDKQQQQQKTVDVKLKRKTEIKNVPSLVVCTHRNVFTDYVCTHRNVFTDYVCTHRNVFTDYVCTHRNIIKDHACTHRQHPEYSCLHPAQWQMVAEWCNIWPPCSPTEGVWRTWRSSCWWSRRDGTARRWQRPLTDSCWRLHNLLLLALLLCPNWPLYRSPRRCYRWWRNPVSSPPPPGHCCLHTQSCRWLHGLGTGRETQHLACVFRH